ncbi:radical SAM protein [Frankia sp. AgB1.9]|uniref:radical SAM/SPASM domain-containing protein n=1 Tax=unclassified Frankia TaxID=2632575 RepID=UPI001931CF4D|nr:MULTISPECIES: radical SAM protein [unclassified Frankia]MBL7494440.1 radical SAM protein [Frankia sp. AgW1.1]MBL7547811.1 radical SAM protein [Frankia sp. AgB1.9]MBL7621727.1 radical SAM protein [Frankia sp. AgB1.8]
MTTPRRTYAVWELTLACNLACGHCGSRAGSPRDAELTTAQALDVVAQLDQAGIDEVTLIGGEAFLRRDWLTIAAAITGRGMTCTVTTGGYRLSAAMARGLRAAGVRQCSVSVDGMAGTHDRLRGRAGSWQSCFVTMERLRAAGVTATCNTQINRLTAPELPELYLALQAAGIAAWQWQLTVPMGNAADQPEILLQPVELLDVFPMLARVARQAASDGIGIHAGNNVGYYGPYERLLRSPEGTAFWTGCQAGLSTLGIEADGTIKGCPSLPTRDYAAGDIRERPLADLLRDAPELAINTGAGTAAASDGTWGFCRTCEYADVCRGGCTWTAHTFFGRGGNNPYCHHRALTRQRAGVRERLVQTVPAPGRPFDHGLFELVEEDLTAPWPAGERARLTAADIRWPTSWGS